MINGIGFHVKFKRVLGLRQCHGLGKPCHGRYPGFLSPPKLHIFLISPSLFDIWPVKRNIFFVASPIFFIICSSRGMNHSLLSAYRILWVRCIRIQTEPYLNSNSEQNTCMDSFEPSWWTFFGIFTGTGMLHKII